MKTEIRPATAQDVPALALVHHTAWQETYTGLIDQAYLDARTVERSAKNMEIAWPTLHVAVCDGRVVGFCGCGASRDEDLRQQNMGEIQGLYLLQAYQHLGLGRALMENACCRLRAAGFCGVSLWVLDSNAKAICFYEKAGFTADGTTKTAVIGTPVTELRYSRRL